MILVNTPSPQLDQRATSMSSRRCTWNTATATAVKAYVDGRGNADRDRSKRVIDLNAAAPFTASFSSRGPLLAAGGDLLKPDLIAPGQDILAGVAPPDNSGRLFDLYSGTSMSSPHVAGLAALFKELHPTGRR